MNSHKLGLVLGAFIGCWHYTNWGVALARLGKRAEAIERYQQALRLKPDNADAHTNWGRGTRSAGQAGRGDRPLPAGSPPQA